MEQRLNSHNVVATKGWTVKFRPWEVAYAEAFETKQEAIKREKHHKISWC